VRDLWKADYVNGEICVRSYFEDFGVFVDLTSVFVEGHCVGPD